MIERRSIVRHKTFIKGRIYFNNRLSSMDCIVRDVTDNGSRLEFSESVALPELFEIYLPNKDEYFQARIEWRKGDNIGVCMDAGGYVEPAPGIRPKRSSPRRQSGAARARNRAPAQAPRCDRALIMA